MEIIESIWCNQGLFIDRIEFSGIDLSEDGREFWYNATLYSSAISYLAVKGQFADGNG